MSWIQSQAKNRNGLLTHYSLSPVLVSSSSLSPPPFPYNSDYEKESASTSSSGTKITPAVIFIIIILAVVFFISGLLHLLVRFLIKHRSSSSISESNRYPEMSGSNSIQRQLQQLFHLHDSGLDQAFIDALPVFLYKEIMGLKEPFDCAVCLLEFSEEDKLRLLPLCSHAFHIDCIDTWLLSNSSCPLCRGILSTPLIAIENPIFEFEDHREEDGLSGGFGSGLKPPESAILSGKRVFSVRLGKYKNSVNEVGFVREVGETSSSNLDARRCYSMGSYQYVEADSELQVTLCPKMGSDSTVKVVKGGGENEDENEGKRIKIGSKGESFSVSKIWLWSKKGKFSGSSDTHMRNSSVTMGLPWTGRNLT